MALGERRVADHDPEHRNIRSPDNKHSQPTAVEIRPRHSNSTTDGCNAQRTRPGYYFCVRSLRPHTKIYQHGDEYLSQLFALWITQRRSEWYICETTEMIHCCKAAHAHIRSREPDRQQYYITACVNLLRPQPVHRLVPATKVAYACLHSAQPRSIITKSTCQIRIGMILSLNLGATLPPKPAHAFKTLR